MSSKATPQIAVRIGTEDRAFIQKLVVALTEESPPEDFVPGNMSEAIRECIHCCKSGKFSPAVAKARANMNAARKTPKSKGKDG